MCVLPPSRGDPEYVHLLSELVRLLKTHIIEDSLRLRHTIYLVYAFKNQRFM